MSGDFRAVSMDSSPGSAQQWPGQHKQHVLAQRRPNVDPMLVDVADVNAALEQHCHDDHSGSDFIMASVKRYYLKTKLYQYWAIIHSIGPTLSHNAIAFIITPAKTWGFPTEVGQRWTTLYDIAPILNQCKDCDYKEFAESYSAVQRQKAVSAYL